MSEDVISKLYRTFGFIVKAIGETEWNGLLITAQQTPNIKAVTLKHLYKSTTWDGLTLRLTEFWIKAIAANGFTVAQSDSFIDNLKQNWMVVERLKDFCKKQEQIKGLPWIQMNEETLSLLDLYTFDMAAIDDIKWPTSDQQKKIPPGLNALLRRWCAPASLLSKLKDLQAAIAAEDIQTGVVPNVHRTLMESALYDTLSNTISKLIGNISITQLTPRNLFETTPSDYSHIIASTEFVTHPKFWEFQARCPNATTFIISSSSSLSTITTLITQRNLTPLMQIIPLVATSNIFSKKDPRATLLYLIIIFKQAQDVAPLMNHLTAKSEFISISSASLQPIHYDPSVTSLSIWPALPFKFFDRLINLNSSTPYKIIDFGRPLGINFLFWSFQSNRVIYHTTIKAAHLEAFATAVSATIIHKVCFFLLLFISPFTYTFFSVSLSIDNKS